MAAERVFTVAGKEFTDHLTSRKFLVILALLLMFALLSMHQGIDQYNKNLESYNQQLQVAGDSAGPGMMPERPSILSVFGYLVSSLIPFGGMLAIATGFDLISKEKESRSLKTLLSHPVYRDEVINGKALGGVAALGVALVTAFALTLAVLLVCSIVPKAGEVVAIGVIGFASLLYLLAFFALALALSVVTKESGHAVIYGLALFFAIAFLLPVFGTVLGDVVAGDPPQRPEMPEGGVTADGKVLPVDEAVWMAYEEECRQHTGEMEEYRGKRQVVTDTVNLFSPITSYYAVVQPVADPSGMPLEDAADQIWWGVAALIVFSSVFFAVAYGKFMRMDIR
jgi:ABC-2 type transport system permease protein